nr:M15 family metallopeptidase [Candidatus Chromulinivorax destructor]
MKSLTVLMSVCLIVVCNIIPVVMTQSSDNNFAVQDVSRDLQESQQKFAKDVVSLLSYMLEKKYNFTFGETMRTKEQAELYAQQGKGIKNSLHCKRLAIDINLFNPQGEFLSKSEDHTLFGEYWESLSPFNRWGGRFIRVDGNHYERNETFENIKN